MHIYCMVPCHASGPRKIRGVFGLSYSGPLLTFQLESPVPNVRLVGCRPWHVTPSIRSHERSSHSQSLCEPLQRELCHNRAAATRIWPSGTPVRLCKRYRWYVSWEDFLTARSAQVEPSRKLSAKPQVGLDVPQRGSNAA